MKKISDKLYPDTKRLPVFLGTEFVDGFLEYITDGDFSENSKYRGVKQNFGERIYPVNDTDENYRTINHWGEENLLLDDSERGSGWRKFNLVELCWLGIIRELRDVGFSLDKIRVLKEAIFKEGSIDGKTEDMDFLGYCLVNVLLKNDMLVVVDKEGRGTIVMEAQYLRSQMQRPLPETIITISLNKIYARMVDKPELKKKNQYLLPVTPEEITLLGKVALTDDLSEVHLKIRDKKIGRADYKTQKVNPENAVAELRKMLADDGRNEMVIKKELGKVVLMERTEKT